MKALLALSVVVAIPAFGQPCQPTWSDEFPRLDPSSPVAAYTTFNDGAGPMLVAAGPFGIPTPTPIFGVAGWRGGQWRSFGDGLASIGVAGVQSVTVVNEGPTPRLYAGGYFNITPAQATPTPAKVARWSGAQWEPLPVASNRAVQAISTFDDGAGERLYAAFGHGINVAMSVARWDGTSWTDIGGDFGSTSEVHAMLAFDDGSGPALYIAGKFSKTGTPAISNIARLRDGQWKAVGQELRQPGSVNALCILNVNGSPTLCAGGWFIGLPGVLSHGVAKWNGAAWEPLGPAFPGTVTSLTTPAAPGHLIAAGYDFEGNIAEWDGLAWRSLGSGLNGPCTAAATFREGETESLFVSGGFNVAGNVPARNLARWDGQQWSTLAAGGVVGQTVNRIRVLDDGTGPRLFVAGNFTGIGDIPADSVAAWSGGQWSAFRPREYMASDVAMHDLGNGPVLCATGLGFNGGFWSIASRWAQDHWEPLPDLSSDQRAQYLRSIPAGPFEGLYAAGTFTLAGVPAGLARWDGEGFQPVGGGLSTYDGGTAIIGAITEFDDGSGPALYVGGEFQYAGQTPINRFARWNGQSWSEVGGGIGAPYNPSSPAYAPSFIGDLATYDDGSGPALFVAGKFSLAGQTAAMNIAKWNGSAWAALQGGVGTSSLDSASALAVFDDGSGPALFVGGQFTSASGVPARNLAKWNGHTWAPVAGGLNGPVITLAVHDDCRGPSLWVGGSFSRADQVSSYRIARLIPCPAGTCYPNCDNSTTPPILNISDYLCFLNQFATASPYANCDQSTVSPTLNVVDFICFMNKYAAGCP